MWVKVKSMTGIDKEAEFDSGRFLHGKSNSLQSSLDESPSGSTWYCLEKQSTVFAMSSVLSAVKFTHDISIIGHSTAT